MNLNLSGRTALITGGGRGIGRETARSLAREGAKVIVVTRTPIEPQELFVSTDKHSVLNVDLMLEGSVDRVLESILSKDGSKPAIDILVNNLGGAPTERDPLVSISEWRNVMRLNCEIAVEFSNALIPLMRSRKWGRIINISSIAGVETNGPPSYAAAKAAICAYTRNVGRWIATDNVIMTALLVGAVNTVGGYWEERQQSQPDHVSRYIAERCPLGRLGRPEEVAQFVTFLASQIASFNPGAVIPLDGGQLRGYTFC